MIADLESIEFKFFVVLKMNLIKEFRLNMSDQDLFSKYKNDVEFSIYVKMILALAFVEINNIYNSINLLYD
jgi:hypothetical protein